jgi:hypothetical protein
MHTFQVKPTPVLGVWEIGIIDKELWKQQVRVIYADTLNQHASIHKPLHNFVNWLFSDEIYSGGTGWVSANFDRVKKWHTDGSGSTNWPAFIILITKSMYGTIFRKTDKTEFYSKPYTIYLVRGKTIHRSPDIKELRHVTRFHLNNYFYVKDLLKIAPRRIRDNVKRRKSVVALD